VIDNINGAKANRSKKLAYGVALQYLICISLSIDMLDADFTTGSFGHSFAEL
jgi:hypothetical protein